MAEDTINTPGGANAKPAPAGAAEGGAPAKAAAQPSRPQPDRPAPAAEASGMSMDAIRNIPVTLSVVLGSVSVPVSALMKMQRGEVISLGKKVAEPVDILANGKLVARGEIVVVEEGEPTFAISLTELVGVAPAAPVKSS